MRHPRRDQPLRYRGRRVGARSHGFGLDASPAGRKRYPHGRHGSAGYRARRPGQMGQGRWRRQRRADVDPPEAGACRVMKQAAARPVPNFKRRAPRRGAARLAAVQALYQMDIAGTGLNEILAEFESHWIGREVEGNQYLPAEAAFFRDVVGGVVREQRKLDPLIDAALERSWPLKRIEAILRAVLRAGAYELDHRRDVPARVVVTEYVDVAGAFVDRDETGMANAVLDQLAREMRVDEFKGNPS